MTITLTREEAQQVLDALKEVNETGYKSLWKGAFDPEIELLRARLSAPEPEPVAWMNEAGDIVTSDESYTIGWRPLYTAPPQRKPDPILNSVHCQCGASWTYKDGKLDYKPAKEKNT